MKKLLSAVLVSALALGFSLSAASCSDPKDYSSDLASLQQQITELQDKNQELENQMDSVSSQNDALKLQIEKLISSNEIPSYTFKDTIPYYINDVKIFELSEFTAANINLLFNIGTSLDKRFFQTSLSAIIYDHTTQTLKFSLEVDLSLFPQVRIASNGSTILGEKTAFLSFDGNIFAALRYEVTQ